jgi:uncharacterized membrane protein
MKENHSRSIIKGITWRMVGTMDTIFLSWLFTRDISSALSIGGIELFTKVFLFYLHERVWLKVNYGREYVTNAHGHEEIHDKHYRSLVKGISWRLFGTMDTIIIAVLVTGNFAKAFSIGFTEVFTKVGLFYLHERAWQKITWGLKPVEEVAPSIHFYTDNSIEVEESAKPTPTIPLS